MERELKNKVMVVTGGAEGIGYEIADKYLSEGIKIAILLDINEIMGTNAVKNLTAKYGDGRAVFIKCDVTKDLEIVSAKIFKTYKQVDVLVNNAGLVNESSPRKTLEINCIAVMEWTMKFWEYMRKDKGGLGGTIINMGSIYSYAVDPYLVFYKTSKFAVMGLSRSLGHADNFRKFGVRVVIMCPGFTHTTLTGKQLCWDEQLTEFNKFTSLQEWQKAEDVGKAAVEVFKKGDSGTAWEVAGGVLTELPLVAVGDKLR